MTGLALCFEEHSIRAETIKDEKASKGPRAVWEPVGSH